MDLGYYLKIRQMYAPELLYFDHLYSEYLAIKSAIHDEEAKAFIDKLPAKRDVAELSWNDVYYFELILANFQPVEKLRSKIMRLRYDYRSVAGQKEFDDYMASKPPDLMSPPDPTDPPHANKVDYEKLLREDLKYLLGRLYLRYAILPIRETRLKGLTLYAAGLCLFSLMALLGIVAYLFLEGGISGTTTLAGTEKISSLTIFVVVVTGAMGGFVSALQRIQSPPTEGDSLYNLSLLFYGSYSVFIAPITGAIFAILLYLMFTSQILTGSFFPTIYTPPPTTVAQLSSQNETPTPSPSPTPTPTPSPSPQPSASLSPRATPTPSPSPQTEVTNEASISASPPPSPSPSASPSPSPSPVATPKPVPKKSLGVKEFLAQSGPAGGSDYALLIIWCFIAGFAERLVPDALDRVISKNNLSSRSNS